MGIKNLSWQELDNTPFYVGEYQAEVNIENEQGAAYADETEDWYGPIFADTAREAFKKFMEELMLRRSLKVEDIENLIFYTHSNLPNELSWSDQGDAKHAFGVAESKDRAVQLAKDIANERFSLEYR